MERVLIMGQDTALSAALSAVLEDVGYRVAACSDTALALVLLRISFRPFVVLLADAAEWQEQTNDEQSQAWTQVFAAARWLPPHAYIVLSSQPPQTLRQWNVHTQAFVPVVPLPFDTKLLLTRVAEAVRRLWAVVRAASCGPAYGPAHESCAGWIPYYDTTADHTSHDVVRVVRGGAAGIGATEVGLAAQEPRVREVRAWTHKDVARAQAGLVAARAAVARAHEVQMQAWKAVDQARTVLDQARAGRDAMTWHQHALSPMRDFTVGSHRASM